MLNSLLQNKNFLNEVKAFQKKHADIVLDIILFGSIVRGAEKPGDIDILMLYAVKEDQNLNYELRKKLESIIARPVSITGRSYAQLFQKTFNPREGILSEGISLIRMEAMSEGFGYNSFALFTYALKNLNNSQRTRFYYSLYGRKRDGGIIKKLSAIKLTDTVLLVPQRHSDEARAYFEHWKIEYKIVPALLPLRVSL